MVEDLSALADGYAVYLPAVQLETAKALVSKEELRTSGSSPVPLRMNDLNWLSPISKLWHYKWCLASAANFAGAKDNIITHASPGTVILGDSGGYQIGTGAIKGLGDWQRAQKSPADIMRLWSESELPFDIVRWLDAHCDYAMTIDIPLWARSVARQQTPFHHLSTQQLIALSVANLDLVTKHRDRQTGAKFLNVLQAYAAPSDEAASFASEEAWFSAVKDYEFDGWALAGDVGMRGGLKRVLRRLLILRDNGLLKSPRNWCHILGISTTEWAVCLSAVQRAIRRTVNPDFTVSYDSASGNKLAGKAKQYAMVPEFGESATGWRIRTGLLPANYEIATSPVPQAFPATSPAADLFTLQQLNPRTTGFDARTLDNLGDQVLVNHNIYVYVRAMIEANISMFVKGVAPPALQRAVAVIGDLFDADADDWQSLLERHAETFSPRGLLN